MLNVMEILKKMNDEGYGVIAIRHCAENETYNVGDVCRNSFEYGNDENEVIIRDAEVIAVA